MGASASVRAAEPSQTYDLQTRRTPGQIDRIEATLQVGGDLVASDDPKHKRPKLSVVAKVVYDERPVELAAENGPPELAVRYYHSAEAVIKVDEESVRPSLREDRRLIGAATDGRGVTLFSPQGPLTRDELDLIDVMGSSLVLDRLLPGKPVALDESWENTKEQMALLLGLDEVVHADVKSTLTAVKQNAAIVEMAGQVQGTTGGGASTIAMKAKYRVDLGAGRINWFGLAVGERRTPGSVLRGVDVAARVQMQIAPGVESARLSDRAIEGLPLRPGPELMQFTYRPPGGGWEITHGRDWHVSRDDHQTAVIGLYQKDDWVSNCTVTLMPDLAQGEDVTLEQFQADIQRALGKNFGQFLRAGQYAGPANQRVYRVAVQGKAQGTAAGKPVEVPMEWHYYRVADEHGRQAVFAFSMEEPMAGRLGDGDKALVESFQFTQPVVAAKEPTPAPPR